MANELRYMQKVDSPNGNFRNYSLYISILVFVLTIAEFHNVEFNNKWRILSASKAKIFSNQLFKFNTVTPSLFRW